MPMQSITLVKAPATPSLCTKKAVPQARLRAGSPALPAARAVLARATDASCPTCNAPQACTPNIEAALAVKSALHPVWQNRWYPVALLADIPANKKTNAPVALQLLDKRLVAWRDLEGQTHVLDDMCSHRKAPLSEGRRNEAGNLECSYHGWSFDGTGKCQEIPQLSHGEALASSRSQIQDYPSKEAHGCLWVWPDRLHPPGADADATLPTIVAAGKNIVMPFARDLNLDFNEVLENVVDPSHVPWSHHGVQGSRSSAGPMDFKTIADPSTYFAGVAETRDVTYEVRFAPPYTVSYTLKLKSAPVTAHLDTMVVPVAPGKTRIIALSGLDLPIRVPVPRWMSHLINNKVIDGDMVLQKLQRRALNPQTPFHLQTFCPAGSDKPVLAVRRWLEANGHGPFDDTLVRQAAELTDAALLDRLSSHTRICSSCNTTYENIGKLQTLARIAQPAALGAAFASARQSHTLTHLFIGAAVLSVGASLALEALKKHFEGFDNYPRH